MPFRSALCALVALLAVPALAESPTTTGGAAAQEPPSEMPASLGVRKRKELTPRQRYTEKVVGGKAEQVDASDALDEILDELASDVALLGAAHVSPVLLDRITVSSNMNPDFQRVLQARLVAALQRVSSVLVYRCYECDATTARVEHAEWVVSKGIVARADLVEISRRYKAQVVMTADLTLSEGGAFPAMALDVQMVRANDAAVVFAESYRFGGADGVLFRTVDRVQSREARLKDLENRLDKRPTFAHLLQLGAMMVPSDRPDGAITAAVFSYRITEEFGFEREWRYGLSASYVLNPASLVAVTPRAVLARRLTFESLYMPNCFVTGSAGFFVSIDGAAGPAGTRGSPEVAVGGECELVLRFGISAQLAAVLPYPLTAGGYTVGGLLPSAAVTYTW